MEIIIIKEVESKAEISQIVDINLEDHHIDVNLSLTKHQGKKF